MIQHRPAQKKEKRRQDPFNYIVYVFMVATPMFELPQAYDIYSSKDATSVSVYTWGFFFVSSIVWLTYSIKHRLKPLIFMYCLYILVEASIVTGIILYS